MDWLSCPQRHVRGAKTTEDTAIENLTKEISMSCRFINSSFWSRSQYFQSTADQSIWYYTNRILTNPPEAPQGGRLQARRLGSTAALPVGRPHSFDCICEAPKSEHVTPQHTAEDRHECECQRLVLSLTEPVWTVLPWFVFPSSSIRREKQWRVDMVYIKAGWTRRPQNEVR